jgi:hypothetical protein
VPGPDCDFFLAVPSTLAVPLGVLGYVGLSPGQEFIPYFLALLAWAGAACLAVLLWPLRALRRRLARTRSWDAGASKNGPIVGNVPESENGAGDTRGRPEGAGHPGNSPSANS